MKQEHDGNVDRHPRRVEEREQSRARQKLPQLEQVA
jgi:hypothetical protein